MTTISNGSTESTVAPGQYGGWLRGLTGQRWFAYSTIMLLQLSVVWQAWLYRDLSSGDSAGYHMQAWQWHASRLNHICWSPLYTSFYGTVLDAVPDPIAGTLLHRMIIVFTASLMVLALFRKLLTPGLAWLATAWWTVLPINFDTLYEVHLFSLLPILAAWLLAANFRNAWGRGGALAILAGSTLLVRNEMSVASGLWAMCCLVIEFKTWRRNSNRSLRNGGAVLTAYALPLIAVAPVVLFYYQHSTAQFPTVIPAVMNVKHTLNMAQVYSFGYQQRHPEWTASPWTEYEPLMTETFGKDLPSLREMIAANPRAVADHFGWNFSLAPHGLQVLLFNATSWDRNPDYVPVHNRSTTASVLTGVLIAVWLLGFVSILRDPGQWWQRCIAGRGQAWLALACVAAVSLLVIPTQRPRPSYLFALSVTLMGTTAACVQLLAVHWPKLTRTAATLAPLAAVALIALVPAYYQSAEYRAKGTPIANDVRALLPYKELIARQGVVLVAGEQPFEVKSFITNEHCRDVHGLEFFRDWSAPATLDQYLDERGATIVFFGQNQLNQLRATAAKRAKVFLGSGNGEWKLIGSQDMPGREWKLFMRGAGLSPPAKVDMTQTPVPSTAQMVGVSSDGWVGKDGSWSLQPAAGGNTLAIRGMVPRIADADFATRATIQVNGHPLETRTLSTGEFALHLPLDGGSNPIRVSVSFDRLQQLPAGDGRNVAARLFSTAVEHRQD